MHVYVNSACALQHNAVKSGNDGVTSKTSDRIRLTKEIPT